MLKLMKRNVLSLVVGGVTLLGVAAPGAWAQDSGKPGRAATPATQPEKRTEAKAGARIGEPAPSFTLTDLDGKTVRLEDFKGKVVVLEWFNPDCPVVVMHYKNNTFANLHKKFEGKDVVFLAINSGAPGKEGSGKERNQDAREEWKMKHPILLDESGTVGRAYGAKTTPHMFVIDQKGILVYNGAIDDGSPRGAGKTNYVEKALEQVLAGETVTTTETRPYGCGVKYGKGA